MKNGMQNFLFYLLQFSENQFHSNSSGSVFSSINKSNIESLEVILPLLPEQKAIAEILSSLDDKIDLLHRQNKTLEGMAQTLFRQWFIEEADEGWHVGKIADMINLHSGFAFKSKDFIEGGKFGLVTIKNVQAGFFVRETKNRLNFVPEKMPAYCNLKTGDILLSLTGNVARVCHVIGEKYFLNQRVAKLQAKNKKDFSFVYLFFRQNSIFNLLESLASGTAQQNLSPIKTKELKMIIPDRKYLDKFAKLVNPKINKIFSNQSQIHTLENLRDTLLPKLMSGEVRIE